MPKKKEHDGEDENQKGTPTDRFVVEVPRWVVQMVISGSASSLVTIVLHVVLYR